MIKTPKLAFAVTGGDAAKIRISRTSSGPKVDISAWTQSITSKNAVFISVNHLEPLSVLIENPVRKAEVEQYIKAYLSKSEVKLNN